MKSILIDELAYLLKESKRKKLPQPIFFLGAGASVTGNIPLARKIAEQILADFSDSPFIKKLPDESKTYTYLMACLQPHQRNELLKDFINNAKINVTHIYLAQLLKEDFVDYVLTVNFDNLMLRALYLYNIFPSTYDMAILNDLTTTSFKEKSIVYLHGQHHGLWLLNTIEEMDKVNKFIPKVFDSIKNQRPWIFIGYSGTDPIFEHIKGLGRFDNGLYWVANKENQLNKDVQDFLSKPNTNAFYISGYDSDAFMLKLNESLGLPQPEILNNPFSSLLSMINNINDIDDEEHFRGVRERLKIAKSNIGLAIKQFENNEKIQINDNAFEIDKLKMQVINFMISEEYNEEEIKLILVEAEKVNDKSLNYLIADLLFDWGGAVGQNAIDSREEKEEPHYLAIEKYSVALKLKPNFPHAYCNWGIALVRLAIIKGGQEAEKLYNQAIEQFRKALEIKSDFHLAYTLWGVTLTELAKNKQVKEAGELYNIAFEKYAKSIELKPDSYEAYYNWGVSLSDLTNTRVGKEAEEFYNTAFEKYAKSIELKPDSYEAYNSWGYALVNYAKIIAEKDAEIFYHLAFEKYSKSIQLKPDFLQAYYNWGTSLSYLAKIKEGQEAEELLKEAFEKYQKSFEQGGLCYNLACLYASRKMKEKAFNVLEISLSKREITPEFVKNDIDWKDFINDPGFIFILNKFQRNI